MAKESGGSDKHAAQIKALKQALADLEKARATTFRVKVDAPEGTGVEGRCRGSISGCLGEEVDPKLLAEKKAQIDKAKARVDALRKELAEKRQQLVEAEHDLAKLSAATRALNLSLSAPKITLTEVPATPDGKTAIVKQSAPSTLEYHVAGLDRLFVVESQ